VKKYNVVQQILADKKTDGMQCETGEAFAPTNIALCKYWGKRDSELNLPVTSSLSIALPEKGAYTTLSLHDRAEDLVILNGIELTEDSSFVKRVSEYLDLFRQPKQWALKIAIKMNIPVAAGVASSACGFASLISALDDLFKWQLDKRELSILARLGSGSASRSLWNGFVEWHAGVRADGMDSYAEPLSYEWPGLRVGIVAITKEQKPISSRAAMQHTVDTSLLYESWPKKVDADMQSLKYALQEKDFALLGCTAESNALAMHATMLSATPPVCYFLPETISAMQCVWALRRSGVEVYFTEDAGANIKLLFMSEDEEQVKQAFAELEL